MKPILPILLALLSLSVQAEVYKTIGPDGTVIFTDQPGPDAEKVQLPPVPTYSAPKPPSISEADDSDNLESAGPTPYKRFTIAAPQHEATIRDNTGTVMVTVGITPPLQDKAGHRIQFLLDGVEQGEPVASPSMTIGNVYRGSHTVSAKLLDASGSTLLTTDPVTIFMHRPSIHLPARQ